MTELTKLPLVRTSTTTHDAQRTTHDSSDTRDTKMAGQDAVDTSLVLGNLHLRDTADEQTAPEPLKANSSSRALRNNFPLPRELRDEIYKYLLDGKYARVRRAQRYDRAYRFHTNILAVNREIHNESEEYLHEKNAFVVVHCTYLGHLTPWLPFVALGPTKTKYNSLEISYVQGQSSDQPKLEVTSCLLLESDLDIYCAYTVTFAAFQSAHFSPIVCAKGIMMSTAGAASGHRNFVADSLRLTLGNNPFCKEPAEHQRALVARFRNISGFHIRVEINGYLGKDDELKNLKCFMSTDIVCSTALVWRVLQSMVDLKGKADALIQLTELDPAMFSYGLISNMSREAARLAQSFQLEEEITTAMFQLSFDAALSLAHLQLKMRDLLEFVLTVKDITSLFGARCQHISRTLHYHVYHMNLLAVVAALEIRRPPSELMYLGAIGTCVKNLRPEPDDYKLHDMSILTSCPDQSKLFAKEDLPIDTCSYSILPYRPVNMYELLPPVKCPDFIVGLIDLKMLRETNQETRERVHRVQLKRGWHITSFERHDTATTLNEGA